MTALESPGDVLADHGAWADDLDGDAIVREQFGEPQGQVLPRVVDDQHAATERLGVVERPDDRGGDVDDVLLMHAG